MPVIPSAVIANPSAQLKAVLTWAEGMASANFELIGSVLADDYVHTAIPANLGIPVLGSKEHFIKHYQGVLPIFTSFDVCVVFMTRVCTCQTDNESFDRSLSTRSLRLLAA